MVGAALDDRLDETFAALANATRRAILARLAQGEATVNELAAPFDMQLPAISKHIKVLERAGLVVRSRHAQFRPCRLAPDRLAEVATGQKLTVPSSLDSTHAATLQRLESSTTGFDAKFLTVQKDAHSRAITMFEAFAKDGDNKQLKALAADMLPTLKQHYDQIVTLMGNEDKTPKPVKPVD